MSDEFEIKDEEVILHRISETTPTAKQRHFKLRHDINETGVSCNLSSAVKPEELLGPGTRIGSWVAAAPVGEIRKLGLEVVIVAAENNPGHCEIKSGTASLDDVNVRDELAKLFQKFDAYD